MPIAVAPALLAMARTKPPTACIGAVHQAATSNRLAPLGPAVPHLALTKPLTLPVAGSHGRIYEP